jgi:hypothetical protein
MPRRPRIAAAGYPVHTILRGIDRSAVFFADDDRRFFLDSLTLAAGEARKRGKWVRSRMVAPLPKPGGNRRQTTVSAHEY